MMVFYILDGYLFNSASLGGGHRLGCGLNYANLPKVSILDLAHVGNKTSVAEFTFHIDSH